MEIFKEPDRCYEKACGIDFGSSAIAVAVTSISNPLGAQLVGNLLANETTPGVVKLYRDVFTVGEDAVATATICPQNVFSYIPLLLRHADNLSELKDQLPDICYSLNIKEDGELYFDVTDDSMFTEISLTQIITILFKYIHKIVSVQYPEYLEHTVVALPGDLPACASGIVLDAAYLAGFKDVQLITTVCAQLYHYAFNNDYSKEGDRFVLFVDQGSTFLSTYLLNMGNGKIVNSRWEHVVGSRELDHYLYQYFVDKLKGKADIKPRTKQAIRLMNGCRRLKEMLSAASKAAYTVDGLLDGEDYQLQLSRAQFEDIIRPYTQAFEGIMEKVKNDLNTQVDYLKSIESIEAVEMIGGGCRVPILQKIVKDVFGAPLRFTVDSASCIAKGCSLVGLLLKNPDETIKTSLSYVSIERQSKEIYERNREICEKITERTAKQEAKSEMINRFESLISQMRSEMNGEFGDKLDRATLEPLLNAEDDWLMQVEDETVEVITDRFNQFDNQLKTSCKEYFDAKDAKHKEIEKQLEEESKKRVDDDKEDVKLPYKTRLSRVEVNKKEGNDLFKDKNYSMAVQRYMRALGHCTKFFDLSSEQKEVVADLEKSLRLNLAQCFIKLEGWEKAIEHCTNVLQKDPKNTKALYRRAFCYDKLKDVEKCTADLKVVITLIPDDASVKNLYNRNELNRKRLQEKRKAMAKRMFGN